MGLRIVQVDAFASRPFTGNPAAVCILPVPQDERWMQDVAREMNLAETAFLYPENEGYRLRWFTPTVEVALCGHATLASAHVLWEEGRLPAGRQARFHTQSGLLTADRRAEWIELDFPATPSVPAVPPPGLARAELTADQAAPRGGVIRGRLAGDRVKLAGQAVTVLRGGLLPPNRSPSPAAARPPRPGRGSRPRSTAGRGTRPDWTAGSAATASSSTIATQPSTGRSSDPPSSGDFASATGRRCWTADSG